MTAPIRLYWWRPTRPYKSLISELISHPGAWARLAGSSGGMRNFGDEVGRDILEALSRRKAIWSPIERADVASVGSILNSVLKRGSTPVIFGSGLREPVDVSTIERLPEFISVRGANTRSVLGLPESTPISDPGIVVSEIYPAARKRDNPQPTFIPHFAMLGSHSGRDAISQFRSAGWQVVLPNLTPREMAAKIANSAVVVTSSLHAIVFSHSYGVPVARLAAPGHSGEPDFKYLDYSSALNLDLAEIDLKRALSIPHTKVVDTLSTANEGIGNAVPAMIRSVIETSRILA